MTILGTGVTAPDFTLPAHPGSTFRLSAQRGKPVVLFFYPQDDTEGCTNENLEFSALYDDFSALGVAVAGISPDTLADHENFARKYGLRWPLIADPGRVAIDPYGAWGEKTTFGRTYTGLIRTTYLIDAEGRIAEAWKVARVKNHAAQVLQAARALSAP